MARKINDYTEIIRIYNADGVSEAYAYMQAQYGIKCPYSVIKRLKEGSNYHYDVNSDKFTEADDTTDAVDTVFMSMEELCNKHAVIPTGIPKEKVSMEELVKTLIEDRLLQLSRYVQLNQANKQVFIDKTSLVADGYEVKLL